MRILDAPVGSMTLADLNMLDDNMQAFAKGYKRPNGMVLLTGPTGSGKSTTLYTTLNAVASPEVNVITVENPVEYRMNGINQVQVNEKAGMTFEAALRSILRSDPDIVLIGEIRDQETAKIAIESALTGHLVLSTLHTNDAPSTATRLIEMGVEPFLVGQALSCVVAQRLVRKLCPSCKRVYIPSQEQLDAIGLGQIDPADLPDIYEAVGCKECAGTGYRGRMAIHEVMLMDGKLEKMVATNKTTDEIANVATENGMTRLREDCWEKVKLGFTSIDEIFRVTA
jgi:type IV pilus assembly protein PilB